MLEMGKEGHGFGDAKGRSSVGAKAEEKQGLGVRAAPHPHVNLVTDGVHRLVSQASP